MLSLSNLSPNPASRKQKKRLGRGHGSGHGKTAGRGHKGANARSGRGVRMGFEGGQMPLQRRVPKRGFNNIFKKEYTIISLSDLDRFATGSSVDRAALLEAGLIDNSATLIKVLANGEITKPVTVSVDKVSGAAQEKIVAAGGKVVGE